MAGRLLRVILRERWFLVVRRRVDGRGPRLDGEEQFILGVVGRRPVGRVRTLTRQPQRPRVDPREPGAHHAAEPGERRQQPVHVRGADHVGIRPGHHVKSVERPQHVIAGKPA